MTLATGDLVYNANGGTPVNPLALANTAASGAAWELASDAYMPTDTTFSLQALRYTGTVTATTIYCEIEIQANTYMRQGGAVVDASGNGYGFVIISSEIYLYRMVAWVLDTEIATSAAITLVAGDRFRLTVDTTTGTSNVTVTQEGTNRQTASDATYTVNLAPAMLGMREGGTYYGMTSWGLGIGAGVSRSADSIDSFQRGDTNSIISCTGLDASPTTQIVTVTDGTLSDTCTINTWSATAIDVDIDVALPPGTYDIEVTDDTGTVTLADQVLLIETGRELLTFNGITPPLSQDSIAKGTTADHGITPVAGDMWGMESNANVTYLPNSNVEMVVAQTHVLAYWFFDASTATMYTGTATLAEEATLTNQTLTSTGQNTQQVQVDTNVDTGDIHAYWSTSATPPSVTDLEAGTGAAYKTSQAITTTGTKTINGTGLVADTTYYCHLLHNNSGVQSAIVTTAGVATDAAPADTTPDAIVWTDVSGAALSSVHSDVQQITGVDAGETLTGVNCLVSNDNQATWNASVTMVTGQTYAMVENTASAAYSTAVDLVATVNGVGDTFTITTMAQPNQAPVINDQTFNVQTGAIASVGDYIDVSGLTSDGGSVTDFEGISRTIPAGIPLRERGRVVIPMISGVSGWDPDDVQTWNMFSGAVADDYRTLNLPADQAALTRVHEITDATLVGDTITLTLRMSGTPGDQVRVWIQELTTSAVTALVVTLTSSLQDHTLSRTIGAGATGVQTIIRNDSGGNAKLVNVEGVLLENVTGKANQNPSAITSDVSYSDYRNGNRVVDNVVIPDQGEYIYQQYRTVCLVGDSITARNFGPGTTNPNEYTNYGWFTYFSALRNVEMTSNYGVSGRSLVTMALDANLDPVIADNADMCILLLSSNDITSSTEAEVQAAVYKLVSSIVESGKVLLLGLIPPRETVAAMVTRIADINAYATNLGQITNKVIVADTWTPLTSGGVIDTQYYNDSPAVHPGAWGALLLGEALSDALDGYYFETRNILSESDDGNVITTDISSFSDGVFSGSATYTITDNQLGIDGLSDWTEVDLTAMDSGAEFYMSFPSMSAGSRYSVGDEIQLAVECEIEGAVQIKSIELQLALTPSSPQVSSSRAYGNALGFLNVTNRSGRILKSPKVVIADGTTSVIYRIKIYAGDATATATMRFRNPQVINHSTHPTAAIGSPPVGPYWRTIGAALASDPDLDTLTYSIIAGNTDNDIEIDPITGELSWANAPDPTRTAIYNLTVQVTDGALTASAVVTVNVIQQSASTTDEGFIDDLIKPLIQPLIKDLVH